jgi:uncharacterized delta-60 repeat protein
MIKRMPLFGLLAMIVFGFNLVAPAQKGGKPVKPSPTPTPTPAPTPPPVTSGPGSIDTTFGQNGRVPYQPSLPNGGTPVHRRSVLQSDGKIVTLMTYGQGGIQNLLARLNADGTLDDSFGASGYAYIPWAGAGTYGYELTKQVVNDEERFVVAGWEPCGNRSCLRIERFTNTGDSDPTFGSAGKTSVSVEYARAITVQPSDQKIVIVNGVGDVVRLLPSGIADGSFGSGGVSRVSGLGFLGVTITSTGRILASGRTTSGRLDFAVVRLNSNGSLDNGGASDSTLGDSFGIAGKALTDFGGYTEEAYSVVTDSLDRVIASGQAQMGGSANSNFNAVLVRYSENGQLDTTFGNGGKTWLDIGNRQDLFTTLALQSDGKIVATGEGRYYDTAFAADMLTARYNDDGTTDATFGAGGWVMLDGFGFYDQARSILMQPDPTCEGCEKIVIAGGAGTATTASQAIVVRYQE